MSKKFFSDHAKWPRCVSGGPFLFFSGRMGIHPKTGNICTRYAEIGEKGPARTRNYPWVDKIEAPIGAQAIATYEGVGETLQANGGGLENLLRFHLYQLDKRFFPVFDSIRRHYEPKAPTPSTAVGMGAFDPERTVRFNIDGIALNPKAAKTLGKRMVHEGSKAHSAAAHFSHVVGAGPYLFVAGQIPTDTSKPGSPLIRNYPDIPKEGRFLSVGQSHEDSRNGPIAAQSWFVYDLIRKHLEGSGSSLKNILNLTVYLQDMRDFPTFHRIHERFFPKDPPALTVMQVAEVGHKGEKIEIEPTALMNKGKIKREVIRGDEGSGAQMSLGIAAGGLLFLSNLVGLNEDGEPISKRSELRGALRRKLPKASSPSAKNAVFQGLDILDRMESAMKAAGSDMSRVTHLTLFLQNIAHLSALEPLLRKYFPKRRPAFTAIQIPEPSPVAGTEVSMTAIGWIGDGDPEIIA